MKPITYSYYIHSLLEIVSGINKVTIPSGIKYVFEVLVFIKLSKSPLFRTVWGLLYKERSFEFISKLFLQCIIKDKAFII